MGKAKVVSSSSSQKQLGPSLSPEAREQRLINLSYNLVEQRLLDGTATSQETTHFLKLGSTKERREREKLEEEVKLLKAKTENLQSMKRSEELMEEALKAFRTYSGQDGHDEY